MLRFRRRWHDAANRILSQESRLLWDMVPDQTPGYTPEVPDPSENAPELQNPPMLEGELGPSGVLPADLAAATRSDITGTLEAANHVENHPNAIPTTEKARASLEQLSYKVSLLHGLMENIDPSVEAAIHRGEVENMTAEQWTKMKEELLLKMATIRRLNHDIAFVDRIQELQNVQLPPMTILARIRTELDQERQQIENKNESTFQIDQYLSALEDAERALKNREKGIADGTTIDKWKNLSEEERLAVYECMNSAMHIPHMLVAINATSLATLSEIEKRPKLLDLLKDLQKNMIAAEGVEPAIQGEISGWRSITGKWSGIKQALGIEFYTPRQLFMAFEELKEAFLEVRKQTNRLKASKLSALAGRALSFLPYFGHDFELILETSQVKKNDEVKNGFKEALSAPSWDPGFNEMFEPGGLMDQNFHDKNRTRAIIEFAAGKGMLYDITDEAAQSTKTLFGRWSYRDLVPSEWTPQQVDAYWGNMIGENATGGDKRAEIAKDLTRNVEKAADFVKIIEDMMKARDLWFAKGVIERAFDRGKSGHLASWIAVVLMKHLQHDKILRKIVPIGWMDKMGVISAKTAAWAFGPFNFQRNYIHPWARSGTESMKSAGILKVVDDIRDDILKKDHRLDPENFGSSAAKKKAEDNLNLLIARVMATQMIQVGDGSGSGESGGQFVTIFDRRYDYYNKGSGGQRDDEVDVKKLSDDFFGERSEILMSDTSIVAKILEYGSTRLFSNEFRARKLFSHAVDALKELQQKSAQSKDSQQKKALWDAAERLRTTFGEKMIAYLRSRVFPQTGTLTLPEFLIDDQTPAFMNMVRSGFVPLSVLKEALNSGYREAPAFARRVLSQLLVADNVPASMRDAAKKLLNTTSDKPKQAEKPAKQRRSRDNTNPSETSNTVAS